jgi:predicted nucleic acid-binding protein
MNRAKSGKKKQRDLLHTLCQRTTTTYSGILFITANTPTKRLKILKADEPDNRVLECAIKAKADFIITGNKRHFPFEEFKGSKIVTPREFINSITEL